VADDALCIRSAAATLTESVGFSVGGRLESAVQSGNREIAGKMVVTNQAFVYLRCTTYLMTLSIF